MIDDALIVNRSNGNLNDAEDEGEGGYLIWPRNLLPELADLKWIPPKTFPDGIESYEANSTRCTLKIDPSVVHK